MTTLANLRQRLISRFILCLLPVSAAFVMLQYLDQPLFSNKGFITFVFIGLFMEMTLSTLSIGSRPRKIPLKKHLALQPFFMLIGASMATYFALGW